MDVKSGSKLRIDQIQFHIKEIFIKIAMKKEEQFNIRTVLNT